MAQINNAELTQELIKGAKLFNNDKGIPSQLADKVVPVMEVNPKLLRRINLIRRVTANGTIYTCPTDKDFFLVSYNLGGTCTATGGSAITITPKGDVAVVIGTLFYSSDVVVTINSQNITQDFSYPILLERGSAIVYAKTGTTSSVQATIFGYIVD